MRHPYQCLLLFGAPGVGKGTQGQRLCRRDRFVHLATGDMFRGLDKGSELGLKFLEYSSRGELVPDELTLDLWEDHVQGLIDSGQYEPNSQVLVLDGIPRSARQAELLDGRIEPLAILHLAAPKLDDLVERMMLRAKKEGRPDDADETVIRRRFEVYKQATSPVLEHYDDELIREIDAIGTIDEVEERVWHVVEGLGIRQ